MEIRDDPAIPIVIAIDHHGRKARRQRAARHDMIWSYLPVLVVEIDRIAAVDIHRAKRNPHALAVDEIKVDEFLQRVSMHVPKCSTPASSTPTAQSKLPRPAALVDTTIAMPVMPPLVASGAPSETRTSSGLMRVIVLLAIVGLVVGAFLLATLGSLPRARSCW